MSINSKIIQSFCKLIEIHKKKKENNIINVCNEIIITL